MKKVSQISAASMLLLGVAALTLASCECCTSEKEEAMIRELRMNELKAAAARQPTTAMAPAATHTAVQ